MNIIINLISLFLKLTMYSLFSITILLFIFLLLSSNKIIGGKLCLICFILFILFIYLILYEKNISNKKIIYNNN